MYAKSFQSCQILCDPMDCNLPGSSVHGILQARILEWVAFFLLQGIFPTQGSKPHLLNLLHWQIGSLPLVPPGKSLIIYTIYLNLNTVLAMKNKQFTVIEWGRMRRKRTNHTLFSMTERNVIRSYIEQGSLETEPALGNFHVTDLLSACSQEKGSRKPWVVGIIKKGRGLHWRLPPTWSHRGLWSMNCTSIDPTGRQERWSYISLCQPLIVWVLPGGVRSGLTNPKWLGAVFSWEGGRCEPWVAKSQDLGMDVLTSKGHLGGKSTTSTLEVQKEINLGRLSSDRSWHIAGVLWHRTPFEHRIYCQRACWFLVCFRLIRY